ncbi:NAD(P)H-dependent glycerol-3-phosphate dehydrogenase [Aedoeadaptatus coxii]|uniref:Glycerol-3-phosphate dehydrogenase [NAD(P)+] n=1 Tax=Aedoeadaptatus coxii TaxID=755172 RepID=A0A134ABT2_9FIRM|nr:NAD(P)H-dependent glycerol-3-phosphate dehydrogenase [Peptoniphilus coxii]KXB65173.1 glycerol-3-phosphate dehydrogenase [NAD(P)+ ] [Peptoniphilus coxii]
MNIGVIGSGSWGSAIGNLLATIGHDVHMYTRSDEQYRRMKEYGDNPHYLKDFHFAPSVQFHCNFDEAVRDTDVIVLAVPTAAIRETMEKIRDNGSRAIIVNLAKGLEQGSHLRVSEIAKAILPENPFVVLSGPSHAEEVAKLLPTTVLVCSENKDIALKVQDLFTYDAFRVYVQDDMIGVEIGGALKNIIALGAGLSDGLGYGDNAKAALMTRGITEIQRLGIALGAKPVTFQGLSGIGDLIVTCTSVHSRNWQFGNRIGKGMDVEEAIEDIGQVVEGYKTTKAAYELAKDMGIEMPITEKLYKVLYGGLEPRRAVLDLMQRPNKHENEKIFLL